MRRVIIALFIIIGIQQTVCAESLLDKFDNNLKSIGVYRVEFIVAMDGYSTRGSYIVSGNDFYLTTDGVEYYVADGVKWQVSSQSREVTVDSAESLGSDILSNPASAFSLLKRDFDVEQTTVEGRQAALLTVKGGGSDRVTVVADAAAKLPQMIVYSYDTSSVTVILTSIEQHSEGLPRFDSSKYPDFEIVDMR